MNKSQKTNNVHTGYRINNCPFHLQHVSVFFMIPSSERFVEKTRTEVHISKLKTLQREVTPLYSSAGTEGRQRYSSYPFTTRHQKEVHNQHHAPTTFPAKRSDNYCTICWVCLETSLDDENLTPPQGFDTWASQSGGSHYNDYTIPAPLKIMV